MMNKDTLDIIIEFVDDDLPEPKARRVDDVDIDHDQFFELMMEYIQEYTKDLPIEGSKPIDISCVDVYLESKWSRK